MKSIFLASAMATSTRFAIAYDTDFYAWTQQQTELLWQGQIAGLHLAKLTEEIESFGKRDHCEFNTGLPS
jgi:hypothetical protein